MLNYDESSEYKPNDYIIFKDDEYGTRVSSDNASYRLVEEFPFGMGTPDSSKLSGTIKKVEKEIRRSIAKK